MPGRHLKIAPLCLGVPRAGRARIAVPKRVKRGGVTGGGEGLLAKSCHSSKSKKKKKKNSNPPPLIRRLAGRPPGARRGRGAGEAGGHRGAGGEGLAGKKTPSVTSNPAVSNS